MKYPHPRALVILGILLKLHQNILDHAFGHPLLYYIIDLRLSSHVKRRGEV